MWHIHNVVSDMSLKIFESFSNFFDMKAGKTRKKSKIFHTRKINKI